jgi:hypothetical protein
VRRRLWQQHSPPAPENSAARFIRFRTGSYADAQRLFKSFLARNELVASVRQPPDVILAGSYYILINPFRSPAIAASVRLRAPNFCMMLFT